MKLPIVGPVPVSPVTMVDRFTNAEETLRLAARAPQVDGREPFVTIVRTEAPASVVELLPPDAEVVRSTSSDMHVVALAVSPRGTFVITTFPSATRVEISAGSPELLASLAEEVRTRFPKPDTAGTISLRTWRLNQCNDTALNDDRRIAAPRWAEVARNYPKTVRAEIEELLAIERPETTGKLILWHGEPGTGKTTALRALLREWEPWCAGQYIADAERLFSNPGYISEVLTAAPSKRQAPTVDKRGEPDAMWRLIIAEDSDEYLRASARRDAGAGLGRLLNLADGVLGQGFNSLILLTTNEELTRLHPALIRPGRCLARIEFSRFSPVEAQGWLPDDVPAPLEPATLADLFERRGDLERIGTADHRTPLAARQYV